MNYEIGRYPHMKKTWSLLLVGLTLFFGAGAFAAERSAVEPLAADRWLEIDLYWFDRSNIDDSCEAFWDRFTPLFEGVQGWRGVILNVGWTVDYVMDWSGDLDQEIPISKNRAQQPWSKVSGILAGTTEQRMRAWQERFAHPVDLLKKEYEPWTYGDLKHLAETLRLVAEKKHGLAGMRVGVLTLGWKGIYGTGSPWAKRHPEVFVGGPKGSFVGFLPATRMHADPLPLATLPHGVPEGMPMYEVFAKQWGGLSKAAGLDAMVLRDSMLLPRQYIRSEDMVSIEQARFYHEGAAAMVRETKKANPKALVIGYSNGASAMSDWRCNGVDLESIFKEGYLDAWIDQTWAGAWNEVGVRHGNFWNVPYQGWTYQLTYMLLHAAMLADSKVRHYPLVETFDAWESWDIIGTAPDRLKWGIWAYSHAAVKTPTGIKMPAGTYISWANQGTRLLEPDQVDFLSTNINAAVRNALSTTDVLGPTMVYCRDAVAWQMEHAPQVQIKEWFDEQIGGLIKWPVPINSVTRMEYLPHVESDAYIVGTPANLQPKEKKTLVDMINQGQPIMLVGDPNGGIDPDLLKLAGIEPLPPIQDALRQRASLGDAGPLTAGLPAEFEINQYLSPVRAVPEIQVLYTVDGSPALTVNTNDNRKLIYWDPPALSSLRGRPMIEGLGGVESYVLAARAINSFLSGNSPWAQTIDPWEPMTVSAWHGANGTGDILAGHLEEGLNIALAKSRKITREQYKIVELPSGLDLYANDGSHATMNLPDSWRAAGIKEREKTVDIDLPLAGSVHMSFNNITVSSRSSTPNPCLAEASEANGLPFLVSGENRASKLKDGWKFISSDDLSGCESVDYDDSNWEPVPLPHTWQSMSDQSDFSHAWYRLSFDVPLSDEGKQIYVRFDGAGITSTVYLNGVKLRRHVGSYTAFVVDVTKVLNYGGRNVLAVMCDSKNDIAGNLSRLLRKQNRYFCVPGGINRMAWLIKTAPCHIDPQHFGSSGIYVIPKAVNAQFVDYEIKTMLRNSSTKKESINVKHLVYNQKGEKVGELSGTMACDGLSSDSLIVKGKITSPDLWSPKSPSLYKIETIVSVGGKPVDSLETTTGFRSLSLDGENNIILNGEKVQLVGASIHEYHEKRFSAVLDTDIDEYLSWFNDIGFNSVFFSHYPPHPHAVEYTDRHGLMAWVENGFVNGSYEKEASSNIVQEMIYQNWNRPSIFCWSLCNETYEEQYPAVHELIKVAKSTGDTSRLFVANQNKPGFSNPDLDFISVSSFYGWYRKGKTGSYWGNTQPFINQHGAGGLITQQQSYTNHTFNRNIWDPEGYQQIIAETASSSIYRENSPNKMFFWWEMREHGEWQVYNRLNAKGLLTFGGYKKDAYYLFKSLNKPNEPLIHICGKHWFIRDINELKVYSNLDEVTIQVRHGDQDSSGTIHAHFSQTVKNGEYLIDNISLRNVFLWRDLLKPGRNEITVTDKNGSKDNAVIYFQEGEGDSGWITDLKAENGQAAFINIPVQEQMPFYSQFDGTANNTWDEIPEIIRGAAWISTRRQSHPDWVTDLSFKVTCNTDVFVVVEAQPRKSLNTVSQFGPPRWLIDQGFTDTGIRGQWRTSHFLLKYIVVMKKTIKSGDTIKLSPNAEPVDWVCLLKSRG